MVNRAAAKTLPATPEERLLNLDVLRGFAIFGVLLAYLIWDQGRPDALSPFDQRLGLFFEYAVDSKLYTILSFLFGLGFFLQLNRAQVRGASLVPTYIRRLAALAGIGMAHGLFLRNGDILLPYAVTGLLLLPFRTASNRLILAAAVAMLLYAPLARATWEATGVPFPVRPDTQGLGHFASNWIWYGYKMSIAPLSWFGNLATFLLGFYAGRNQLLVRIAASPRTAASIAVAGLVIGVTLYVARETYLQSVEIKNLTNWQRFAAGMIFQGHAWAMAACYIAAILLLLNRDAWRRRLKPLAAAGRMALTNYVMQAMLVVPICLTFGFYDNMTPSLALVLALGLFLLVQIPFSVLWLRRFDYGPMEWLWRVVTYGEVPRRDRHAQPEPAPAS